MTTRFLGITLVAALAFSAPEGASQWTPGGEHEAGALALMHVTTIDGTGSPPRRDMTVLIEDGVIRAVFPSGSRTVPQSYHRIDLSGRYLTPGLVNSHLHVLMLAITPERTVDREQGLRNLERMLYAGVTAIRDPAGDARVNAELARVALAGAAIPRIYFAARFAGPSYYESGGARRSSIGFEPGTVPWAQAVTTDTDLPLAVARAAGSGAIGIKIYADVDADLVDRLTREAHRQGLEAWAHATVFPAGPAELVRSRVDVLSHACFIFWGMQDEPAARMADRRPFDPAAVDVAAEPYGDLFTEMAAHGTLLDATARNASQNRRAHTAGCTEDLLLETLHAATEARVPLSTGTDYFTPEGEPDPTLFTEIAYLVEQNVLTPLEAITAATLNGARAIGIDETHGSIEVGKVADLVVLEADPTADIGALQAVHAVIKDGVLRLREDYDARRAADEG